MLAMLAQAAHEEGLTFAEVLADIPHDVPAMVVYAMVLGSIYLLWRTNRKPRGQR